MENEIRERDIENQQENSEEKKSLSTLITKNQVKKRNYLHTLMILWMTYLFWIGIYFYVRGDYVWMMITETIFGIILIVMCIKTGISHQVKEEIMSNLQFNTYTIM
jgi:hypothetical protein